MEHNHKDNTGKRIFAFIIFIITLPFVLGGVIIFGAFYILTVVLPAPIEMIIYKRSVFYKDLKVKYSLGITSSFGYKSYKYVKKNPCLDFVCQSEGYYYYKAGKRILVIPYYAQYLYDGKRWQLTMKEGGEAVEPKDVKVTFQYLIKENLDGYTIRLLVKEKYFRKDQLFLAKADPVFVFYKNHKDFENLKV